MIDDSVNYIKGVIGGLKPKIGIVIGSGMGEVVGLVDQTMSILYESIPYFLPTTIEGHSGELIFGKLNGVDVVVLNGRNHFYEGHTMKEITLPIRVLCSLGIEILITSNATGSLNESYEVGDIMIVKDHINLMGSNPLIGENDDSLGPRFLDMSNVYNKKLIKIAEDFSRLNNIKTHQGVLTALSGPTYETPAEYKWLRTTGADAVGMSTIPEVTVAHHMGVKVFSISLITNTGVPGKIVQTSHEEVQRVARESSERIKKFINGIMNEFNDTIDNDSLVFSIVTKCITPVHVEDVVKCVESIRRFHPNEKIVIVDSDSPNRSYMDKVRHTNNLYIEDIKNTGYEAGAMWHVYNNYVAENYVFMQDSMQLTRSIEPFIGSELKVINIIKDWFGANNGDHEFAKEYMPKSKYVYRDSNFKMVQYNSYLIKRKILDQLKDNDFDKIIPYDKHGSCAMERITGIVFTDMGLLEHDYLFPRGTFHKIWRSRK